MKRITNYLIAMAMMAFTFTSCEDVPNPFGQILSPSAGGDDVVVIDPAGSGTLADPYNVQAIIEIVSALDASTTLEKDYYVKGIVTNIPEGDKGISTSYNNASFYISDDTDGNNSFYVYRCLGIGGGDITDANFIKVGDEVVIFGKSWVNYQGNTPETTQKTAYVYSINGSTEGGGDTPSPTEAKAVSVSDFLAAAESTSDWYQLTGTIKNLKDGDQYGNFDIEDATGSVYVYGLLSEKGGEKKKFQELVAAKGIANGKKITINANRGAYNGTPQATNAYFVSIGEGGGDTPTPSGDGDGTEAKPYNVSAAIAAGAGTDVFIKAYIVGWIDGKTLSEGAKFNAEATVATNIIIAGAPDETDLSKCMPVQLPSGAVRSAVNLQDHADNYKKEILLVGNIEKYFGATGVKSVSYAKIGDTEAGTKPGGSGGDTPSDGVKTVTIADFNAAAESDSQWYKLTGTVKNLKDGDQYGNFDLEDATGSVYVYGLLSEKDGAKKKFQELVAAKGIANGSKITIIGLRSSYNGQIQVKNAYFVSIEGGSSSGGGQSTGGTGADGSTIITVADFNAAAVSTDVWYQLTGTIKNLKDGDQYGNFDLEDSTGSVYVYGVLSEKGGAKKKFQDLVTAKGIANGKTITIVGNRGEYNGKIEVLNAYFIKVE